MDSDALHRIARQVALDAPVNERLRLQFGYACATRVRHFLEDPAVVECLVGLGQYLAGTSGREELDRLTQEAERLARQHRGSSSIDGSGHAAVSASYAVANALAGRALQAAEYAAYAAVYGQGGYGAVSDRESFEPELQWQADCLASLAAEGAART